MSLRDQLTTDEGRVPHAYQDSEGYWTIGVGRLIDKLKGGRLSEDEMDYLLNNDIRQKTAELERALPWVSKLDTVRREVLIALTFNMGIGNLLGFKNTLAAIERGDYAAASSGLLNSKWAQQVKARRANRYAQTLLTGQWQD